MAIVKGFKGLRYNTEKGGDLNTLVCPPYDIISEEQREKFIESNEHNIIRLELPAGENKYREAGVTLEKWLDEGILTYDDKDSIYFYEMVFTASGKVKSVKGFVSLIELRDFADGVVLPHEETLSKAKADRFNLMSETNANFSQIYSLYMDEDGSVYRLIDSCSQGKPDMEVTDNDGTVHKMWCVSDEKILSEITAKFADKKLYIADGHHRYETALNYHRHLCANGDAVPGDLSAFIPCMLVNMENDGLVVFPTHRIVRDMPEFDEQKVSCGASDYFDIKVVKSSSEMQGMLTAYYDEGSKAFAMYTKSGNFTVMKLRDENAVKELMPEMSDAYCGLDVSVLHTLILERIMGIDKENMANQKNLTYTRSFAEALAAVDDGKANCAFILNPTKVREIRDVAAASEKMPQKSTYFYPKLITGLVMNKFKR